MRKSRIVTEILDALVSLHSWRQRTNGTRLGLGYDPHMPMDPFEYDEAYALWGSGYLRLFEMDGDPTYAALAREAGRYLLAARKSGYEHACWGLPWAWKCWDASENQGYLITTVLVGLFLLRLNGLSAEHNNWLETARSAGRWMLEEDGGISTRRGLLLFYADHPKLRFKIPNPSARASGFFAVLHQRTQEPSHAEAAQRLAWGAFDLRNAGGLWRYSERTLSTDNVHTAFTLEGLSETNRLLPGTLPSRALSRSMSRFWRSFFSPSGFGREIKSFDLWDFIDGSLRLRTRVWVRNALARRTSKPKETRLWGYAAALRAFTLASWSEPQWLERAIRIFRYLQDNLRTPEGAYRFRAGDPSLYIRHEAHVFDALACLAQRIGVGNSNSLGDAATISDASLNRRFDDR